MKIVIIGAGIAGLTSYIALQKYLPPAPTGSSPHSIHIYETYPSPRLTKRQRSKNAASSDDNAEEKEDLTNNARASLVGGGLGIGPNGMAELRALDPSLHDEILRSGYPGATITLANAHGWVLARMAGVDEKKGREYMVWIARQEVWGCIRRRVPDEAISTGKTVEVVEPRAEGAAAVVKFKDGKSVEADLVIGADGVWSTVKKSVVGDGVNDDYPPHFEELMGVGGFMPGSYLDELPKQPSGAFQNTPFVMTFGADGFFGYGAASIPDSYDPPTLSDSKDASVSRNLVAPRGPVGMWWSTWEAPKSQKLKDVDIEQVQRGLAERHKDWADPVIRKITGDAKVELLTNTFTMPVLPRWSKPGVVLLGDSAHALPSTSGQGISQAFEDVRMFTRLLGHHLKQGEKDHVAVDKAAETYEKLRKPRTTKILDMANKMGGRKKKMGLVQEYITYFFLYIFLNFFPDMMTSVSLNYSVDSELEKIGIARQE